MESAMELLEALEAYLVETGQINPLAQRQARLLCGSVADETLQKEARIFLLLNLAALHAGAPRAPRDFLLAPLRPDVVQRYAEVYRNEHPGSTPSWEAVLTDPGPNKTVSSTLDEVLQSPRRLSPLTGEEPPDENAGHPLLIIGRRQNARAGFSRYWRAAAALEKEMLGRLHQPTVALSDDTAREAVRYVFGAGSILEGNRRFHYRQVTAAALALRTRFLIISGGPGSGKTSVLTQVLRTLMHACGEIEPDRIVLCAPTGRAKARLGDSIDRGIGFIEKTGSPGNAKRRARDLSLKNLERKTIHGLLGARPDSTTKYNSGNPLSYQVIVVDEASMVDLCLFASLMEAAAPECRMLLVGDMHQLPSVEAGAVLGDLTDHFAGTGGTPTLTARTADWVRNIVKDVPVDGGGDVGAPSLVLSTPAAIQKAGRLADHAIVLSHSYRSTKEIMAFSEQINCGDAGNALRSISENDDSTVVTLDTGTGIGPIKNWLNDRYSGDTLHPVKSLRGLDVDAVRDPGHRDHAATLSSLDNAFRLFDASRILTLAHGGQRGRISINSLADRLLRAALDEDDRERFFHGQQVLLGQNLPDLDLYNGDMGMVVHSKNAGQKVVFRRGTKYTIHALERIAGLESAFAITVHKSQGSEFDSVLLVLPEYKSPLLTRQVLYTGITRAKNRIRILGTKLQLQTAIETKEERPGGLNL